MARPSSTGKPPRTWLAGIMCLVIGVILLVVLAIRIAERDTQKDGGSAAKERESSRPSGESSEKVAAREDGTATVAKPGMRPLQAKIVVPPFVEQLVAVGLHNRQGEPAAYVSGLRVRLRGQDVVICPHRQTGGTKVTAELPASTSLWREGVSAAQLGVHQDLRFLRLFGVPPLGEADDLFGLDATAGEDDDELRRQSTLIGYRVKKLLAPDGSQFVLDAIDVEPTPLPSSTRWQVNLDTRHPTDGEFCDGAVALNAADLPWGLLVTEFRRQGRRVERQRRIVPFADLLDIGPATTFVGMEEQGERNYRLTHEYRDPLSEIDHVKLHVGRLSELREDFDPSLSTHDAAATERTRAVPTNGGQDATFLVTPERIHQQEDLVLQAEFHLRRGERFFGRAFHKRMEKRGRTTAITAASLAEREVFTDPAAVEPYFLTPVLSAPTSSDRDAVTQSFDDGGLAARRLDFGQNVAPRFTWSANGHVVYYFSDQGRFIHRVDLESGRETARWKAPVTMVQMDFGRQGLIVLGQQQAWLLDPDNLESKSTVDLPGCVDIAAGFQTDRVIAASQRELFRVDWERGPQPLGVRLDFAGMADRVLREAELSEDGEQLLLSDGYRMTRVSLGSEPRVEESTVDIAEQGQLYFTQGGRHVALLGTQPNRVSQAGYPTPGMFVYAVTDLSKPLYSVADPQAVALLPFATGHVGRVRVGLSDFVFGNASGRPVRSYRTPVLSSAERVSVSPDGARLLVYDRVPFEYSVPDPLRDPAIYGGPQNLLAEVMAVGEQVVTQEQSVGRWRVQTLPWKMRPHPGQHCWSADGRVLYVLTESNTIRRLSMPDLLETHRVLFPQPVLAIGLSKVGLVVRPTDRQELHLRNPADLAAAQIVSVAAPDALTMSASSDRIWAGSLGDGTELRQIELPSGEVKQSYSRRELLDIMAAAESDVLSPTLIGPARASSDRRLRPQLSPDGKSIYLELIGLCRFDVDEDRLRFVDTTGPSRRGSPVTGNVFVSHDSRFAAIEGFQSNARDPIDTSPRGYGTFIYDVDDLGRVAVDATTLGHSRGLAMDPKTRDVYTSTVEVTMIVIRGNAADPEEVSFARRHISECTISASPAGSGVLFVDDRLVAWLAATEP